MIDILESLTEPLRSDLGMADLAFVCALFILDIGVIVAKRIIG